ncbi:MAG: mannosyltransferase family protein [Chthoniobacterales bacterium]
MNSISETAPQKSGGRGLFLILPKEDWLAIGWTLAIKLLLVVFGAESCQILTNQRGTGLRQSLELWNRWDALHYLRLAELGYSSTDPLKAWFYPLFPWTVRLFAFLTRDYLVAAFVVSGLALAATAVLLRRLVARDYGPEVAIRAVWFFLIFPTAYFLHIGYTESLFLAFLLASLLAARNERWWMAGVLGALCWMTRPTGIVLLPTLAMEAAHQFWETKRWRWHWLWIGLVPAGFGVYLLLNLKIAGSAFAFLPMREQLFHMSGAWPWIGMREAYRNQLQTPTAASMVGTQELLFACLGLFCMGLSWIKLRPMHAVWITGSWLLVTSASYLASEPRYALTLYPIFILLGFAGRNRFWNGILTTASLLFLGLFAGLFVRGWWAF